MGRKENRQNMKKYGYTEESVQKINEKSLKRFIKISGVILLILVVLYLIIAIFITKEIDLKTGSKSEEVNSSSDTAMVSNTILANNTFRQKEEVYYVYFYDYSNKISDIDNALAKVEDKIYRVNTIDALNNNYVADNGNRNVTSIEDLKVKSPTLIKIDTSAVVSYYEGKDEILNSLN